MNIENSNLFKRRDASQLISTFSQKKVLARIFKAVLFKDFEDVSTETIAHKYLLNEDDPDSSEVEILSKNVSDEADAVSFISFYISTPSGMKKRAFLFIRNYDSCEPTEIELVLFILPFENNEIVNYKEIKNSIMEWMASGLNRYHRNKIYKYELACFEPEEDRNGDPTLKYIGIGPCDDLSNLVNIFVIYSGKYGTGIHKFIYDLLYDDELAVKEYLKKRDLDFDKNRKEI